MSTNSTPFIALSRIICAARISACGLAQDKIPPQSFNRFAARLLQLRDRVFDNLPPCASIVGNKCFITQISVKRFCANPQLLAASLQVEDFRRRQVLFLCWLLSYCQNLSNSFFFRCILLQVSFLSLLSVKFERLFLSITLRTKHRLSAIRSK